MPTPRPPRRVALARAALALATMGAGACATVQAHPSEPISTDRPTYTNGPDVVEALQAEAGASAARDGATHDWTGGELLVRVPVTDRLEARADVSSYRVTLDGDSRASGYDDPSVGVKARIGDRSPDAPALVPKLGAVVATTLPLGSRDVGERVLRPSATLAASWEVGPRAQVQSNLGYAYESEGGEHFGQFASSVSLTVKATSALAAFAEYYDFLPGGPHAAPAHFADGGVTYQVTNDFQLDARVGGGGTGPAERKHTVGVGLSRRW